MSKYLIRQSGGSVQGPFEEDQIKGWIRQGRVKPDFEFSRDGQQWIAGVGHHLFDEVHVAAPVVEKAEPIAHATRRPAGESGLVPCPVCAELIQRNAQKCRFCSEWVGRTLQSASSGEAPRARNHPSYASGSILGFLLPFFFGLIYGVVYMTKPAPLDKKLGEHVVAVSILTMVLYGVAWNLFLNR